MGMRMTPVRGRAWVVTEGSCRAVQGDTDVEGLAECGGGVVGAQDREPDGVCRNRGRMRKRYRMVARRTAPGCGHRGAGSGCGCARERR